MEGGAWTCDSASDVERVIDVGRSSVVLAPLSRVFGSCKGGSFKEEGGVGGGARVGGRHDGAEIWEEGGGAVGCELVDRPQGAASGGRE